ncbi:hypothetical protein BVRB_4g074940 [Beta vulgaris subsp. vulgaris]|nr:hypothetical protein BVRB_4g074940 [Beta vulgaris subsp. vulgaris]
MTKSLFSFLKFLIFTIYVAKLSYVWADQPETLSWAKTIPYGHEQKTTLEFYYHEFAFGENATVAWIAQAQPPQPNPPFTAFGNLYMVDGRLTVGPDVNSKLIGRAQVFLHLKDAEGRDISVGEVGVSNHHYYDGWYNRRICSIVPGEDSFAAVHYTIFSCLIFAEKIEPDSQTINGSNSCLFVSVSMVMSALKP